jgi:hypothetical protein
MVSRAEIGRYRGCWAFPVHYKQVVVAIHYRFEKDGKVNWFYEPKLRDLGVGVQPLTSGYPENALTWHATESTWDHHVLCDQLDIDKEENAAAAICTRGAANEKLLLSIPPEAQEIFLWPQNDKAGEGWLAKALRVLVGRKAVLRIARVPQIRRSTD